MAGVDFRAVKEAVKAADVLRLLNFRCTESRGPQRRGMCPLHAPRGRQWDRCCSVNLDCYVFRCFACRAQGDLLWLYAQTVGLPVFEAALQLCREAGVPVPAGR